MPPWPLTHQDPTQFMIISPCCGEESEVWYNHPKSKVWWKFILWADPKYQDLAFPPQDDLLLYAEYDYENYD